MRDRLLTAPADSISGADFFHAIFGDRAAREAKATAIRLARAEHRYAVQAAYRLPTHMQTIAKIAELQAALKARIAEIEAGASEERKAA